MKACLLPFLTLKLNADKSLCVSQKPPLPSVLILLQLIKWAFKIKYNVSCIIGLIMPLILNYIILHNGGTICCKIQQMSTFWQTQAAVVQLHTVIYDLTVYILCDILQFSVHLITERNKGTDWSVYLCQGWTSQDRFCSNNLMSLLIIIIGLDHFIVHSSW